MSIPSKYNRTMRRSWGMHSVWLPGSTVSVGDIVIQESPGELALVGNLKSDFDIAIRSRASKGLKASFKSSTTKVRYFQGGVEASVQGLDPSGDARVEFSFTGTDSYFVSTPEGTVETLENLIMVGDKLVSKANWQHNKYYIVREVFSAEGFTVLGSKQRNRKATFSGKANALIKFVTLGLSAGVAKSSASTLDVEFVGNSGALGVELARVKPNGLIVAK